MRRDVGEIRNQVSGIAANTNVAKITVRGVIDRPGNAARLFESLTAANISVDVIVQNTSCLLYTSPSPRDRQKSRMPSCA